MAPTSGLQLIELENFDIPRTFVLLEGCWKPILAGLPFSSAMKWPERGEGRPSVEPGRVCCLSFSAEKSAQLVFDSSFGVEKPTNREKNVGTMKSRNLGENVHHRRVLAINPTPTKTFLFYFCLDQHQPVSCQVKHSAVLDQRSAYIETRCHGNDVDCISGGPVSI